MVSWERAVVPGCAGAGTVIVDVRCGFLYDKLAHTSSHETIDPIASQVARHGPVGRVQ